MFRFLAALPAVLGLGGFAGYVLWTRRHPQSETLRAILDSIAHRTEHLPTLDSRLRAKEVFRLLSVNPELREAISPKDFELLRGVMVREERETYVVGVLSLIAVLATAGLYVVFERAKTRIVAVSVESIGDRGPAPPNTYDDLAITWGHSGEDGRVALRLSSGISETLGPTVQVEAGDHKARIPAHLLRTLWPSPDLSEILELRVVFQTNTDRYSFGPYEIRAVLVLNILLDPDENKLTIYAKTGGNSAPVIPHSFSARCVAYATSAKAGGTDPRGLTITAVGGKGVGSWPMDFHPDPTTIKCAYLGSHPIELVRYRNLNIE